MLKWFTKVQTTGGNERYVSLPVHFRWNLRQKIYPEKILLHQTIRRENSAGVRSVNLGRILLLWPDRTEMAINCQKKAQLLIEELYILRDLRELIFGKLFLEVGQKFKKLNKEMFRSVLNQFERRFSYNTIR